MKETFDDLELWRKEFLIHAGININEADSYPFVLLGTINLTQGTYCDSGNKVDRENQRAVLYKTAETWCQRRGNIPYIETSGIKTIKQILQITAKDATNVEQAFMTAAELALNQRPDNAAPP